MYIKLKKNIKFDSKEKAVSVLVYMIMSSIYFCIYNIILLLYQINSYNFTSVTIWKQTLYFKVCLFFYINSVVILTSIYNVQENNNIIFFFL